MPKDIKFWRYAIPGEDGHCFGWGIFLLDSTGMFAAVTDYGDYVYKWPYTDDEGDFRRFVIGLADSWDYLLRKVARKEYNGKATLASVKDAICRARHEGYLTKEQARDEWNMLRTCNDLDTEWDFAYFQDRCCLEAAYEYVCRSYDAGATAFATVLMPRLAEVIKRELAAEEGAAA